MNINIIAVGKIKEQFYKDAIAEYAKRLSRFCKFNIIETPEAVPYAKNKSDVERIKNEESKYLLGKCKGVMIILDLSGKLLTSPQIGKLISDIAVCGNNEISFVIGGSHGLSDEIKEKSDYSISFGKITYPHQLMRVILSEQIYRAFMINEGSEYHK